MKKLNHKTTQEILMFKTLITFEHIAYMFEGYRDKMISLHNIKIEEDGNFAPDLDKYSEGSSIGDSYALGAELAESDFNFIQQNKK